MEKSSNPNLNPCFIKGHVSFGFKQKSFEFQDQNLSVEGLGGLPWGSLTPAVDFGEKLDVKIEIPGAAPLFIETPARITSEKTVRGHYMGLRFQLTPEQKAQIHSQIAVQGFIPTDYLRKYPRIPSLRLIQTFPLRALVVPPTGSVPADTIAIVFDVQNISPNGALISCESQVALGIEAGMRVELVLEPRGWFPTPIKAHGIICRITDERDEMTGNLIRSLGIKFTKIDDSNRAAFLDLLKDILESFKKNPGI